jgi:hypothetical protein
MNEFLKRLPEDYAPFAEEQAPDALALRLDALMQTVQTRLPSLGEFRKSELIQTVYYPALQLHGEITNVEAARRGATFLVHYLETVYDDKFKDKKEF